ncbi:MAG: hypothetical protein AMXMBFR26_17160 [Porticoccaceae bacterium]
MTAPSTARRDLVLVVDDAIESLGMLHEALDREGFTVLVALEGVQALAIARHATPDIVLLDALMPNLDGFETCRRLKADRNLGHVPVIFMTGLSDTESIVKGFAAGGVDYVTKPIRLDELLARMKTHIGNARLTQSARTALDSAGQFLVAADRHGALRWTTPQAQQLLTELGASPAWLGERLPRLLAQLQATNRAIDVDELDRPFQLHYLGKIGNDELLLRLVKGGGPSATERLRTAFGLTEREAEVLLWVGNGKANREIAVILAMSPRTVNKHLEQIFRKLGVENRTSAAALALRQLERSS